MDPKINFISKNVHLTLTHTISHTFYSVLHRDTISLRLPKLAIVQSPHKHVVMNTHQAVVT